MVAASPFRSSSTASVTTRSIVRRDPPSVASTRSTRPRTMTCEPDTISSKSAGTSVVARVAAAPHSHAIAIASPTRRYAR